MATKDKKVVISTPPIIRPRVSIVSTNYKRSLQRSAKFGPQLIAEGLLNGVTNEQGNLVKGFFDDPNVDTVDPSCNIDSDKFVMMNQNFQDVTVDPVED